MGACATKPGDLKVKGEAPLVEEDAASPAPLVVAGEEKEKAVGVPVAAEADPADASRRRSLSDLLKQDAETSDGEGGREEEKAVAAEPASAAAGDAGATMGSSQAPVQQDPDATEQDGTTQGVNGDAQAQLEEEKRVDPESVQVAAAAAAAAATPSAEESKVADEDASA